MAIGFRYPKLASMFENGLRILTPMGQYQNAECAVFHMRGVCGCIAAYIHTTQPFKYLRFVEDVASETRHKTSLCLVFFLNIRSLIVYAQLL